MRVSHGNRERPKTYMKRFAILIFWSCMPALIVACARQADPEAVYRQYLSAYQSIRSFDDPSIEAYLSKKARANLAELREQRANRKCDPCPDEDKELQMMKSFRPYPDNAVRPQISESNGVVTLTYEWHEPPGSERGFTLTGTDVTMKVEFVQEEGWKLKRESWIEVENPGTARATSEMKWSY
jgi:hypothetical protein